MDTFIKDVASLVDTIHDECEITHQVAARLCDLLASDTGSPRNSPSRRATLPRGPIGPGRFNPARLPRVGSSKTRRDSSWLWTCTDPDLRYFVAVPEHVLADFSGRPPQRGEAGGAVAQVVQADRRQAAGRHHR
jgi:hypothetical protein